MSVVAKETFVEPVKFDPNLLGRDFYCAGSNYEGYPIYKGVVVGSEINYATKDAELAIIEDRSSSPLRGCTQNDNGYCKLGKSSCPVSSAVSAKDFAKRLQKLRELKIYNSR